MRVELRRLESTGQHETGWLCFQAVSHNVPVMLHVLQTAINSPFSRLYSMLCMNYLAWESAYGRYQRNRMDCRPSGIKMNDEIGRITAIAACFVATDR